MKERGGKRTERREKHGPEDPPLQAKSGRASEGRPYKSEILAAGSHDYLGQDGGAASVQVVEVEHGVEDEKIAAHGFAAPHGIVGKKNDVAFPWGTSTTQAFSAFRCRR